MRDHERAQIEQMMRVVVAMQQLLDTVLLQGNMLLGSDATAQRDAPHAPAAAASAGMDDDPNDPPRLMRTRAIIPMPEG